MTTRRRKHKTQQRCQQIFGHGMVRMGGTGPTIYYGDYLNTTGKGIAVEVEYDCFARPIASVAVDGRDGGKPAETAGSKPRAEKPKTGARGRKTATNQRRGRSK